MKNTVLFLICFLVGSAGIVILKWHDANQFVVTACPVALIIVYGIWSWRKGQDPLRAGDNLYYLGLLYTLVSLAISLFEFTPKDENIESITPIITNFGVAIFSTIFGIAGRVVFYQKQKPDSGEYNLDHELDKAAESVWTFGVRMDGINDTMTNYAETLQEASKSFDESRQKLEDGSDEVSKSIINLVAQINSVQESKDLLERIMIPPIQQGAAQIGTAGEALANRLNNVKISPDALERTLQQVVEGFLVKMDQYLRTHFDKATQDLDSSIEPIEKIADQIGTAGEALANRLNNVKISPDALERTLQQVVEGFLVKMDQYLRTHFDKATQDLDSSIEPIEKIADQIGTAGDVLVQMLKDARDAADDLEQEIRKTATALPETSLTRKIHKKGSFPIQAIVLY